MVSLLAFEGILAIALPTVETASPAKTPIVNNSLTTIPPPAPPELRSSEPGGLAQQATCHSDYYAVFSTEHGPVCAKNPTSLMPHWGPPSQGGFGAQAGSSSLPATMRWHLQHSARVWSTSPPISDQHTVSLESPLTPWCMTERRPRSRNGYVQTLVINPYERLLTRREGHPLAGPWSIGKVSFSTIF